MPGLALIVTGFGFKLAVVPFHLWTPDVNQGAPAPVTAYIATVLKGAMFALLLRFFYPSSAQDLAPVFIVFSIIAIASMIGGNLLALLQNNVKRILAYSSIVHLGYLLVAFQAAGDLGPTAVTVYLVCFETMGAFGVVTVLSEGASEAEDLENYRCLFCRSPALAAVFTAMLLSLAGIPVMAGFIGNFYVVAAGASSAMWALIVILVITSAIGLFYYLRIVVVMYGRLAESPASVARLAPAGILVLGFPGLLLSLVRRALAGLA